MVHMSLARQALFTCALLLAVRAAWGAGPEPLALVHANVVNLRDGSIVADATIVLREGRIASVGGGPAPAGVRVLDLRGKHVLPGLVDAHVHISTLAAARAALESGVTTVRSSGVSHYVDVGLRELARQGAIAGPDVLAAGYHVRPRVADDAFLGDPSLSDLMRGVDSADKVRRMVRANLARGVDWIKVLATERAGTADTDPRVQTYTEAELRAAVEEAAAKGIPVQAHAHGEEGAAAAVRAGVRSIEHGTYLSEATLALMKEKGTFFVPTYTTVIDLVEPGGDYDVPALRVRGQHMLPRLRAAILRAHRLGVKIVTGADTGYAPGSTTRVGQEVANLAEIGLTPLEALRCATTNAAEMLRLQDAIGAIQPGFEADLIAVDGNPLESVRIVQDPVLVVSNGRVAVDRLSFAKER